MPGFDTGTLGGTTVSVLYAQNVDFTGNSLTSGTPQVTQNGQLLIGASSAPYIRVATLTSGTGINIVNGPGTITINSTNTGSVTQLSTDSGSASPSGGIITIHGGQNINTSGSGSTVTINVNNQIQQPNGSTGAPSYSFSSSTNSGIFWDTNGGGRMAFMNAGNTQFRVGSTIDAIANFDYQTAMAYSTQTGQTSQTISVNNIYYGIDTTSARTITLPANPNFTGYFIIIKDQTGSAATNNITIAGNGKTIDGASSVKIISNFGSLSLLFDGTNWNIV